MFLRLSRVLLVFVVVGFGGARLRGQPRWPVPVPNCEERPVEDLRIPVRRHGGVVVYDGRGRKILALRPEPVGPNRERLYHEVSVDPFSRRLAYVQEDRLWLSRGAVSSYRAEKLRVGYLSLTEPHRPEVVFEGQAWIDRPVWSADGKRVAFLSGMNVLIVDVERRETVRRSLDVGPEEWDLHLLGFDFIAWSEDDRYLLCRNGGWVDLERGSVHWASEYPGFPPWIPKGLPLRGDGPYLQEFGYEVATFGWSRCRRYVWYVQYTQGFFSRTTLNLYDVLNKRKRRLKVLGVALYRK